MPNTPVEALAKIVEDRVSTAYTMQGAANTLEMLYNKMPSAFKEKSDTNINWDVKLNGASVGVKAVTSSGSNSNQNNVLPANLRVGSYQVYHQFDINRVLLTERKLLAPTELANDLAATISDGLDEIFTKMNQLFYNGTGIAGDAGVYGKAVFGSTTATYAGIDPSANPLWKPVVLDNGGTGRPLTAALLRKVRTQMTKTRVGFDAITMHPDTAETYESVFAADMNFVKAAENPDQQKVDLALGQRTYMGVPIVEDVDCPTGEMNFWNSKFLDVYSFRLDTGGDTVPQSQSERQIATANTFGMVLHIAELPSSNSAVRSFEMYVLPQFRLRNRRQLIVLKDLA